MLEVLRMKLEGGKRHEKSFEWYANQHKSNCDRLLSVVDLLKQMEIFFRVITFRPLHFQNNEDKKNEGKKTFPSQRKKTSLVQNLSPVKSSLEAVSHILGLQQCIFKHGDSSRGQGGCNCPLPYMNLLDNHHATGNCVSVISGQHHPQRGSGK